MLLRHPITIEWLHLLHKQVTKYFCNMKFRMAAKQSYCLICIPGWVVAHFNCKGNCTTATADILELVKFQASCIQSQCMGVCVGIDVH